MSDKTTQNPWISGTCKDAWRNAEKRDSRQDACENDMGAEELLFDVPPDLEIKLREHAERTGIPYEVSVNLLGSESGFNANAVSATGASGLAQAATATLLEKLYLGKENFPDDVRQIINNNIEKYNAVDTGDPIYRYRIRKGGDEAAVKALAFDEDISLRIAFDHMLFSIKEGTKNYIQTLGGRISWLEHNMNEDIQDLIDELKAKDLSHLPPQEAQDVIDDYAKKISDIPRRIDEMRANLKRPFTTTDLKTLYVCGARGGAEILEALADPIKREERHRAADYTDIRTVNANPKLFFKNPPKNTVYLDIQEFYEKIQGLVGDAPIPENLTARNDIRDPQLNGMQANP